MRGQCWSVHPTTFPAPFITSILFSLPVDDPPIGATGRSLLDLPSWIGFHAHGEAFDAYLRRVWRVPSSRKRLRRHKMCESAKPSVSRREPAHHVSKRFFFKNCIARKRSRCYDPIPGDDTKFHPAESVMLLSSDRHSCASLSPLRSRVALPRG